MLYYYNYNTNQYDLIKKVGSGTRSYTVPGLLACKGYKFMIQAYKTVNSVDYVSDNTELNTTTCPSQVSNFKYNDKVYQFMVNGQTGKVAGKTPLSIPKIIITVVAIVAIIALLYYLGVWN